MGLVSVCRVSWIVPLVAFRAGGGSMGMVSDCPVSWIVSLVAFGAGGGSVGLVSVCLVSWILIAGVILAICLSWLVVSSGAVTILTKLGPGSLQRHQALGRPH
jgi:hypothetical protein